MIPPDDCQMDVGDCEDCEIMDICWGLDDEERNQKICDYERRIEEEAEDE